MGNFAISKWRRDLSATGTRRSALTALLAGAAAGHSLRIAEAKKGGKKNKKRNNRKCIGKPTACVGEPSPPIVQYMTVGWLLDQGDQVKSVMAECPDGTVAIGGGVAPHAQDVTILSIISSAPVPASAGYSAGWGFTVHLISDRDEAELDATAVCIQGTLKPTG